MVNLYQENGYCKMEIIIKDNLKMDFLMNKEVGLLIIKNMMVIIINNNNRILLMKYQKLKMIFLILNNHKYNLYGLINNKIF